MLKEEKIEKDPRKIQGFQDWFWIVWGTGLGIWGIVSLIVGIIEQDTFEVVFNAVWTAFVVGISIGLIYLNKLDRVNRVKYKQALQNIVDGLNKKKGSKK